MASSPGLELDTQFQGFKKAMFSGESAFMMEVKGAGDLLVEAFGTITEVEIDGGLIVDTGHVVAYESSLDFELTKAGSGWIKSWLAGEGVVMHFQGRGKLLVQSHNRDEFGSTLGPKLPHQ